jgi:hypothetical protein
MVRQYILAKYVVEKPVPLMAAMMQRIEKKGWDANIFKACSPSDLISSH